jgi:cell division septation protein DedD
VDSHVKERIVGAAVLVALGVWLIPWVLDGPESEPDTAAVATPPLQLPSPDSPSPIRTETVELATRQAAPPHTQTIEAPQATASGPPPVVRSASADAAAPDGGPPAAAAVPATQSAAPGNGGTDWSVQLGAFGERANASQLAGRVADFGFEAEVREFRSNGRTMYRVRVEGFATRERAEAASSSLAAHGIIPADVVPTD